MCSGRASKRVRARTQPFTVVSGRTVRVDRNRYRNLVRYVVVTFDRNGALVDQTPLLTYDAANRGFRVQGGQTEPFYCNDLPATTIPVQYDSKNFKGNGSLGVWLVHRHSADGLRSDVITFTTQ